LRRHADPFRLTALAAFAHLRGRSLTDGLVDLLIETIHRIGAHAERKVERELLDDLKRVDPDKGDAAFKLIEAGLSPTEAARQVGLGRATVYKIRAQRSRIAIASTVSR
jgi:hypothetical protein